MKISEHLTLEELTRSQTAIRKRINNKAPMHVIENLKLLAEKIFEPTRKHFGKPIRISSGSRSVALNREIGGGSKNSQHIQGQAIDIQGTNGLTNLEIFNYIKDNLIFDQLINEYPNSKGEPSWVHVSYSRLRNRKMVLTIGKM